MQYHFEFHDWERAFELFYRRRQRDDSLVLVISTAPEVSGYWIEPGEGAASNKETKVYRTIGEVQRLEQRVRRARAKMVNLSLGGVVI